VAKKGGRRKWSNAELKQVNYRNHSCPTKKIIYDTRKEAKRAARKLQDRGCDLLTPYVCGMCGFIHIGHARRRGF